MSPPDIGALSVVLCSGSDCRKDQRKAHRSLAERLEKAGVTAVRSPCLGVCHGPVIVAADTQRRGVVIERIRSKTHRKELVAAITTGCLDQVATAGSLVHKPKRRTKALRRAGRLIDVDAGG